MRENVDEAHEWINFMTSTDASLKKHGTISGMHLPTRRPLAAYPEYYEATYGEPLDASPV